MDLQKFGHRLRILRTTAGYTQDQLIDALQSLAASGPSNAYRELDGPQISRWEGGSRRGKRQWKPTRAYLLHLISLFSDQLTPETAQQWATQCGYTLLPKELESFFLQTEMGRQPSIGQHLYQQPPLPDDYVRRTELEQTILSRLEQQQVVALTGLGGTGKSTLAVWAAHQLLPERVAGVIWVDDCRCKDGAFHVFEAQDRIARSLAVDLPSTAVSERAAALRTLLQTKNYLLVLDDVWPSDDLEHLRVQSPECPLLITSRNTTVAHRLGPTQPITINGLTPDQGRNLLDDSAANGTTEAELDALLKRVGYLPLALTLVKTLLQEGYTVAELLAHMEEADSVLEILELEEQPRRATNVRACFDLSYTHLAESERQRRFAQLGCFSNAFSIDAAAAVWGVTPATARRNLDSLVRLALAQREGRRYRLQLLLRDYARQKLRTDWQDWVEPTQRRHTAFYLRHRLYHPQLLGDVAEAPPLWDGSWLNIREAVHWAVKHAPILAATAPVLAHTERAAMLEMIGVPLLEAIQRYIAQASDQATEATLLEISGDLYLLQQDRAPALTCFVKAEAAWLTSENYLASSRAKLRQAGIYLLQQAFNQAVGTTREAQALLAQALPFIADDLPAARRLFYWFDLLYVALVRWDALPQTDVAYLADLAKQTGDERLMARGLHIYRLWCTTTEIERPPETRALGRTLAEEAIRLWHAAGELDKAEAEELWSEYQLSGRCPPDVAHRFADRLSEHTPKLRPDQLKLIPQAGIRWWLQTDEAERIAWLSGMLPRYLEAVDSPEPPLASSSQEWFWVREIIGLLGSLRRDSRRLPMAFSRPPDDHFLNLPEWRVFSGQQAFSLVDKESAGVVRQLLALLDAELAVTE